MRALLIFVCTYLLGMGVPAPIVAQTYNIRLLNTEHGLCHHHINTIVQDDKGFLWIGTQEGLSRFDGKTFRNYYASADTGKSFSNNVIYQLQAYKKGHLLLLSGSDLWDLDITQNKFSTTPFSQQRAFKICTNNKQQLIISTVDSIIICDSNYHIIRQLPNSKPASVAYPLDDDRLFISNGQQQFIYQVASNKTDTFRFQFPRDKNNPNYTFNLYNNNNQQLVFSNFWKGICITNIHGQIIKTFETPRDLHTNDVRYVARLPLSNKYVVGTLMGISIINAPLDSVQKIDLPATTNKDASTTYINTLFIDLQENIWAGTTEGLFKLSKQNPGIQIIKTSLGQQVGECIQIILGKQDDVYANFYGGGTIKINSRTNQTEIIDSTIIIGAWRSALLNDVLYTAGLARNKQKPVFFTNYHLPTKKIIPDHSIDSFNLKDAEIGTMIFADSYGDLWYSVNYGKGIFRRPHGSKNIIGYNRQTPNPFTIGYAISVSEDEMGNIWFGNNKGNELNVYRRKSNIMHSVIMDTMAALKNKNLGGLFALYADKRGKLWMGFETNGLISYDIRTHKVQQFTIENGLSTNIVYGIEGDNKGRIWLNTGKGISCFIEEEKKFINLNNVADFKNALSKTEALAFDSVNNCLWIGGYGCIIKANVDSLLQLTQSSITVLIDDIYVNGKKQFKNLDQSFPFTDNNFQFSFASIDAYYESETEYAYYLEGADKSWTTSGINKTALYNNLTPGNYTFRVKARHKGDTKWTDSNDEFHFKITPPWWQTWWFRMLIAALIITGIILVIRSYYQRKLAKEKIILEKQQAVEKERTRIATDIHDDFGASLSRIKFLSEKMQLQNKDHELLNKDLVKISGYSDEMAEKMGEIVWALNERNDSVGDLFSYCRSYASDYLADTHQLHFTTHENIVEHKKVLGEVRRNMFLCYKEAMHNIRKHAAAQAVYISFNYDDALNIIIVTIHDNGKGIDFNNIRPFANGINNMEQRMKNINGTIEINGSDGTTITLTAPCSI